MTTLEPDEGAVFEINGGGKVLFVILITAKRAYHLRLDTTSSGTRATPEGSCSMKAALKLFPEARREALSKIWHQERRLRRFVEEVVPTASLFETVPAGKLFVRRLSEPDRQAGLTIRYDPGYEVYEAGEAFPKYLLQEPGARFLHDAEDCVIECIGHERPLLKDETCTHRKKTRIRNNNGKQVREAINDQ